MLEDDEKIVVSNNEEGNPYHEPAGSPKGGQFAEGPKQGGESAPEEEQVQDADMAVLTALGINPEDLEGIFNDLEDLNSSMDIPLLKNAQEIEDNVEKFFSKKVITSLESMVGATKDTAPYLFHPKNNPNVSLSIYTCVFGKYRYRDNNAHFISADEYEKYEASGDFEKIFRGITASNYSQLQDIADSYGSFDIDHLEIYGNGVYGTNVYTTTDISYARSYAGFRGSGKLIYGLLERGSSNSIQSRTLENMRRNLDTTSIVAKTKQHLLSNGLSEERADLISTQFGIAMTKDISLLGILLGYDYQISDSHQRNILNLSKWYILKED